ncbi:MAG: hypothetical protein IJ649_01170, partial [Oscillospiraceae bacterium]|nr:hypothetical protein [Oscillospiraceae bacterium]
HALISRLACSDGFDRLFGRICNPAVRNIGICNPATAIVSHYKCLYSLLADCKSARTGVLRRQSRRSIPPERGCSGGKAGGQIRQDGDAQAAKPEAQSASTEGQIRQNGRPNPPAREAERTEMRCPEINYVFFRNLFLAPTLSFLEFCCIFAGG